MYGKLPGVLGAAIVAAGVASASLAFAQSNAPATPSQQAPNSTQGQGMMGGQGMSNGQGMMGGSGNMTGMMDMMSAMTRMANTCNTMMESVNHGPTAPGKPSPAPSHS